ncbi:Actin-related protein 2/3 complex subunit 2 [Nakaseomyces bracarensis]|uniref:Arp2/3 complex 34 kDa subunit n=1 Tax=Nakaseomyces bracarensis TaxID=273131 RepID=A0ABR4NUF4_9SACH
MLHLKPDNLLVQKTLFEAVDANKNGSPLTLDRIISDFDYTTFHISNSQESKSVLLLSIRTKAWQSIAQGGQLLPFLQEKYAKSSGVSVSGSVEPGYDYTLSVDLGSLDAEAIKRCSLLKTLILSYPFHLAFEEFHQLNSQPIADGAVIDSQNVHVIKYRDEENIFVKASSDRVTVIFETIFQDETDKILGKVFLQEFADARKRNRGIQSAPQVLFSHEPPLEIQSVAQPSQHHDKQDSRRFITFVLFPRHFQTDELQFTSVSQLTLFRNYFHYHIKCSKAYMHSRMRYRVDSFVKVLNRAKVDEEEENEDSNRRTITGRKMVY